MGPGNVEIKQEFRKGRSRSRSRSRGRGDGGRKKDKEREDSAERRARIASWNKAKEVKEEENGTHQKDVQGRGNVEEPNLHEVHGGAAVPPPPEINQSKYH